ncbi:MULTISPECIES: ComEA family DNA-binding protein [Aequorivita]|uniref:Helix-hairpin-helix domain-containing protein n=1 Tax=Aequorivita iocasae TaxID=2803865 RepID=A0ABX7DP43_9FLAO|nr:MULTISPECIES: helix-hairpin-helix domain-containing protein [Aequorivita]QQX75552.1 helix-hairpin-helix domain-containing protein [Aequorivita iocasae]UCA55007.1 helix-hairpin-helix domain-containing protein [Aequorivita sp. F7]
MELKSHFTFSKQQRSGILLLLLVIVSLLCIYWFVDFSEEDTFDISSAEIVSAQKQMDSLRLVEIENRKPKKYPFNPNFITDYKGYVLGMSNEEIDRLLQYRKEGKWINSATDFKKVTGVSDSLLNELSPYFKFPDWVTNPKPKNNFKNYKSEKGFAEKPYEQKIDLNKATEEQLQQVSGIGEALSKRIISYREKLGGFSNDIQLYNVFGLEPSVVQRTLNLFTVKTPKAISKINVNTASASDISTIPGISFEMAKKIWEFRRLREKLTSIQELDKIEGMTERKLQLIHLYLSVE